MKAVDNMNKAVDDLLKKAIKRYEDAGRKVYKVLEDAMYFDILGMVEHFGIEAAEKRVTEAKLLPNSVPSGALTKLVAIGYADAKEIPVSA